MRLETYKSIILSLLVLISIGLTYSIWAYQPKLEKADQSEFIQVSIKNQQSISSIVKPMEIIFHKNKQHFVTSSETELDKVMKEISKWSFNHINDVSDRVSEKEFLHFVHGEGKTEIIFPEIVPLHLYNSVLAINEQNLPKGSFDRIVFNVKNINEKDTPVYFISYEDRKIYQSRVNSASLVNFNQNYYRFASALYEDSTYDKHVISKNQAVFLPGNEIQIPRYTYKTSVLDTDKFKDALFSNPNYVEHDPVTTGEVFMDGLSVLNIDWDTMTLNYVNHTKDANFQGTSSELLRKSVEFVNNHAGWEDRYRFAGINSLDQKITFRLFVDGLPVFNKSGMTEIVQFWGKDDVYQYSRPFFTLDFPMPPSELEKAKMADGEEVLQELKAIKNIKLELVQDIRIGYELKRDTEVLVSLEPAWYYRYAGVWKRVPFGKPGGEISGLE
ncbi:regulatory protein YycH of two-component signal transduction system YycFG [Peribacillus deserti]|uniref:Regulatory protein YycH of two-component signal transduction system YycFG n=1 Tax=Peribacillus deserti TaxID=673318 RepID=A0ABS2QK55_9BACI|nr:two-component system activity regulator YycH [Peribacillus deserti]MBM7693547.1 regulatory protein YycH of two-component signal transduction system YycFG [Peribacillus deserti]